VRGRAARAFVLALWPQLDLFGSAPAPAAAPAPAPVPASAARWAFSRPWLASPHRPRALRELEAVRAHFPELDDVRIHVGLTKQRHVLGLASLGETPRIWIRPRRIVRFAIAHEFTHLLQARNLVPGGEATCDLFALARAHDYVDVAPFYLKVPAALVEERDREHRPRPGAERLLHALAREALDGRTARSALAWFRREVVAAARAFRPGP
jgi:hypothetical protein